MKQIIPKKAVAYSEPNQTFKMELFERILTAFRGIINRNIIKLHVIGMKLQLINPFWVGNCQEREGAQTTPSQHF